MTATSPTNPALMTQRKLPIGIQTFRTIREEGYYYVDKTGIAVDLAQRGAYYFFEPSPALWQKLVFGHPAGIV